MTGPAPRAETDGGDEVVVTGTGSAATAPDVVTVALTATCRRDDAAAAVAAVDAVVRAVGDVVAAANPVWAAAPATTALAVHAEHRHDPEVGSRRTGVRAVHGLRLGVDDVDRLGEALATVLAAGGDDLELDAVAAGVRDDTDLLDRARRAAFADARHRAEALAALAGRTLGPVRAVTEEPAGPPPGGPRPFAARGALEAVAVAPSEVERTVVLTVRWQLR
ncbi:SIMPL domain-containing protein [Thalassiella azotivora]